MLKNGQILVFANPSRRVHDQMARGKLLEDIGEEWVFVNPAEAVQKCSSLVAESCEVGAEPELVLAPSLNAKVGSPQTSSSDTNHGAASPSDAQSQVRVEACTNGEVANKGYS
jgi:hypothetical protein